jgi:hypothetical protein
MNSPGGDQPGPRRLAAGRDGDTVVIGVGAAYVGIEPDEAVKFAEAVLALVGEITGREYIAIKINARMKGDYD